MRFCSALFLPLLTATVVDGRSLQVDNSSKNWWELGMGDEILDQVALYYLGHAWFQGADVADVLDTMYRVNISEPWSWTREWRETADRMERLAKESEIDGHDLSAGQAYLRAATYLRASMHRHPDPFHEEIPILAKREIKNFVKFLQLSNYPCKQVSIPYENDMTLPGYLCFNPDVDEPAPTLIFNEGKDGWAEDGKYVIDEAIKRGYHALLWDGPGMGQTIRLQGLPFRHDWENVLNHVIDYLVTFDEVDPDRLALISMSLGGYLGPRATVFEHRLKAQVANAGVVRWYDIYEDFLDEIDPGLLPLLEMNATAFDEAIEQIMKASDFLHWGMVDSMWHHGVSKPSELIDEVRRFTIEGMTHNITTASLIIDAESEELGQALELYEALPDKIEKEYILFTKEEAAQFHVQVGATAILSARMFNWLDEILSEEEVGDSTASIDVSRSSPESFSFLAMAASLSLCGSLLML